ncbi:MAG: hypothetical protein Q4E53_03085 [Eubacteriales bacterium]|nr:hypothetical protein [Eubacteriales bacterium]
MKRLGKVLPMFLLTAVLFLACSITVFAGDSVAIDTIGKDGSPINPYVFVNPSYNYGSEGQFNNGFLLGKSSSNYKYYELTMNEKGGYFTASYNEEQTSYGYIHVLTSDGLEKTIAVNEKYDLAPNQKVRIGFKPSPSEELFVNIALHAHYNGAVKYQANGEKCKEIYYCPCGSTKVEAHSESLIDHVYGTETSVAATCTTSGYKQKTCSHCGNISKTTTSPALGHSYTGTISQNTATNHKIKCSRCDAYTTELHNFVINGSTKTCSKCNYTTAVTADDNYNSNIIQILPGAVRATKLSAKDACITVNVPNGAVETEVYFNNKKIKTLKKYGYFKYSKKGAVKGKYKIRSKFVINGKTQYSAYSKAVKPGANVRTFAGAGSYDPHKIGGLGGYGECYHKSSKFFFKGKKLYVTAYLYNNRLLTLKKVKIKFYMTMNGKKYKKTLTMKVNMKGFSKKKITYAVGSGISDIRNGAMYKSVSTVGTW